MQSGTLLACADPREGDRLLAARVGRVAVLGVGKVPAAVRLAAELRRDVERVLLFGVCGAYPAPLTAARPVLEVLDLCVVGDSLLADEGVATDDGFVGLEGLGLGSTGPWAADGELSQAVASALAAPIVRAATVSSCSGTDAAAAAVAARSGAHVETMESAACAFVCRSSGVPFVEVRCVGNRTGRRAAGGFALDEASAKAQQAVIDLLERGVLA